MLSKEPMFVPNFELMSPNERAKGFHLTGRWIYGKALGDKFVVGNMENSRCGSDYVAKYEFDPNDICRCTGVVLLGQQDDYLYENDVIQNHLGQLFLIENKDDCWVARIVVDTDDEESLDNTCKLKDYLHFLDNSETEGVRYVGNIIEDPELHEIVRKNTGKKGRIDELSKYLKKELAAANLTPVFVDEDGEEHYIDHPDALNLINTILEQAYLPYLARKVIEGGWRREEQNDA